MPGQPISSECDSFTLSDLLQKYSQDYADRAALVFHDLPGSDGLASSRSEEGSRLGRERQVSPIATLAEIEACTGLESICWTYADLDRHARQIGVWLSQHAEVGDRALLVYQPGLEFSAAFFGCLYAGVLPVPASYPKPRRKLSRLANMAMDCQPRLVLTSRATFATISLESQAPVLSEIPWQETDRLPLIADATSWQPVERQLDDLAFLQYTSGSTTEPRGVMVTHRNLLHNMEMIRRGFGVSQVRTPDEITAHVFWLPAYHDMGLIGGILTPLHWGGTSHLLAPATFLGRPLAWLEMLSATGATISGAPNFAYELCVTKTKPAERAALDLSRWRLAFCGAEPIRADTLRKFAEAFAPAGFRADSFYPCYGLAEATLLVTGPQGPGRPHVLQVDRESLTRGCIELVQAASAGVDGDGADGVRRQTLVGCGSSPGSQELRIVDPHTCQLQVEGRIGEIWISGDSVARGYWRQGELSREVFSARLADARSKSDLQYPFRGSDPAQGTTHGLPAGAPATIEQERTYMRTGDLGFQLGDQLYVTGRLKDLLILRGRNHYPQDIEQTAQQAHEAVDLGAAFAVECEEPVSHLQGTSAAAPAQEQLVVVHQVKRAHRRSDLDSVLRTIRRAIVEQHELEPQAIVLIRPASLPLTTSGKVRRSHCRELYSRDELRILAQWRQSAEPANTQAWDDLQVRAGEDSTEFQVVRPDFTELAQAGDPCQLGFVIENWMLSWVAERAKLERAELNSNTPFAELGVDSLTAIELNQELEESLQLKIPPVAAWDYPTPATLANYLAEQFLAGDQWSREPRVES